MKRQYFIIIMLFICLKYSINAGETIENNNEIDNIEVEEIDKNNNDNKQKIGLTFSFSGFNEFRMGMGLFLGNLGSVGHHPFGYDFGILFEYNFEDNIKYNRVYYHITGGVSAMLLGGSMVIAYDNNDMSIGFSPEIGIGLSTLFKIFYRYNFYINNRFNSYEVVFHLCLYNKRK